jgi:hypothetical protein
MPKPPKNQLSVEIVGDATNYSRSGAEAALDTNRYTELCRWNVSVVETVELANEVWLPFTVLRELRAGFAAGSQGPRNEAVLHVFS